MRLLLACSFAVLAVPAMAASAIPAKEIISGAIDGYIRPSFAQFARDTTALKMGLATLCSAPTAPALQSAQKQFKAVAVSYAKIEFLRLGPLNVGDRAERLLFWPDNKGIALRQVQAALAQQDPTAASPSTLQKKSVAMQGLGALEFVLFGTGSEALGTPGGAYRCHYGSAIGSLVDGVAQSLNGEWQDKSAKGPEAKMLNPQPDAEDYRTDTEVLEKLAGSLIVGMETIRDQRITPIIGGTPGAVPKPKSALFWRSGMTVPSLAANFAGLQQFYVQSKYPEALGDENAAVAVKTRDEFADAAAAVAAVTDPIEKAVTVPAQLAALDTMADTTRTLDTLLGTNLAQALELSVGFSQLDGD